MKVNVERVISLRAELRRINQVELKNLEIYKNGIKIDIPESKIREWDLVGLNNTDFIEERCWEEAK